MVSHKTSVAKDLAVKVLTLYKVSPTSPPDVDSIVDEIYAPDAYFEDTFVRTANGIENVKAQFRLLPFVFRETHVQFHRGAMSGPNLTIDSTVTCQPKLLPSIFAMPIRIFAVCELRDGKIIKHEDHLSAQSLLSALPLVGWVYNRIKPVLGTVTSVAFRRTKAKGTGERGDSSQNPALGMDKKRGKRGTQVGP